MPDRRPVIWPSRSPAARAGDKVWPMSNSLLVVHVDIAVTAAAVEAFLAVTEANATASRREPGILRFDVLADRAEPGHFVLVEVYREPEAVQAHRQTEHYQVWRDAVEPMMARPRTRVEFVNLSPDDAGW
jgi:(4S)-4-hydroxy-5-phosphonooxypentane-2,3-dione isomerase